MKRQKHLARKSLGILCKSFLIMGLVATTSLAANHYTVKDLDVGAAKQVSPVGESHYVACYGDYSHENRYEILFDQDGNQVFEAQRIYKFGPWYAVKQNGLWGAYDAEFQEIIPCMYGQLAMSPQDTCIGILNQRYDRIGGVEGEAFCHDLHTGEVVETLGYTSTASVNLHYDNQFPDVYTCEWQDYSEDDLWNDTHQIWSAAESGEFYYNVTDDGKYYTIYEEGQVTVLNDKGQILAPTGDLDGDVSFGHYFEVGEDGHYNRVFGDRAVFRQYDSVEDTYSFQMVTFQDVSSPTSPTDYTVEGTNPDGNQIVSKTVMVPTLKAELSTGGADIEIEKYGIVTPDGQMLIPPMMENTQKMFGPFTLTFDENGFSQQVYDADFYYYGGMGQGWQPDGCKNLLVNKDYKLWKGYDQFYDQFITENRFVIKDNNVYNLIDRDMKIIASGYSNFIELDDGKWYTSDDPSKSDQFYNVVRTNDGFGYHGFDPTSKDVVSPWAKPYLAQAKESGIVQDSTYATQNVTRNEFCRLAASTLEAMDFVPPQNLKPLSYNDTQDKNVLYLSQLGVINGVGNGNFDPYSDITREEAAKILVNLANLLKLDTSAKSPATKFRDSNLVSPWATDYVLTISALHAENGEAIMGGTSETTFDPQGPYTLEQAITTLVRLLD